MCKENNKNAVCLTQKDNEMIFVKRFIFVFIIALLVSSCVFNREEKQASGVYIAKFSNIYGGRFDTLFTAEEKSYYKDFYLYIDFDKTFRFSKPFYHEKDTIYGTWTIFPDQLSNLIELYGTKFKYFDQMGNWVNGATPYSYIRTQNTDNKDSYKILPIKKIKHEFPELCK